jgi:hypothetical protein
VDDAVIGSLLAAHRLDEVASRLVGGLLSQRDFSRLSPPLRFGDA